MQPPAPPTANHHLRYMTDCLEVIITMERPWCVMLVVAAKRPLAAKFYLKRGRFFSCGMFGFDWRVWLLWLCVVVNGGVWLCVVVNGGVWLCVVVTGGVWLWLARESTRRFKRLPVPLKFPLMVLIGRHKHACSEVSMKYAFKSQKVAFAVFEINWQV